jgi:alkanesulfonate monooxygenase SsuD/methylene tetrahydromethanopterin reductase-like flavin-dependent oxidoreductase (luciferase family)
MGRNPHGIFMCAVIDVMHTVQHGVIMYVLESFKTFLGTEILAIKVAGAPLPTADLTRGTRQHRIVLCSGGSVQTRRLAAVIGISLVVAGAALAAFSAHGEVRAVAVDAARRVRAQRSRNPSI